MARYILSIAEKVGLFPLSLYVGGKNAERTSESRGSSKRKGGMMLTAKEQKLLDALAPYADEQGVEIVSLEIMGSKKAPTIRVFIDTAEGVSFDELASAQTWINRIMDEIDPFPGAYMLEVSSPGIDRPLRTKEHFERYAGEEAVVKTSSPLDGRSSFTGTLEGMEGDDVVLTVDGERVAIAYSIIKRAHIVGKVDFN